MDQPLLTFDHFYRKLRRKCKTLISGPVFKSGLPGGLSHEIIADICRDHFGERIRSIAHQHLSGWKSSGAFRLRITAASGRTIFLIFKNAIYTPRETPALAGLPIRPGRSEYLILSQPSPALQEFIPKVFSAREFERDVQYQYIMDDLSQDYYAVREPDAIVEASELLGRLYKALATWSETANLTGMIDYRFLYSADFYKYAYENIALLRDKHPDSFVLREVLNLWPALIDLHSELRNGASPLPQQLIHGDANYSNVYLHKTLPSRLALVDWEWAGFGDPFLDLASLLKGVDDSIERRCVRLFSGSAPHIPRHAVDSDDGAVSHLLNQLERGILDASFLSAHLSRSAHDARFDVSKAIMNSLGRVLAAFRRLSGA
jgi:hypothetical protein